MKDLSGYNEIIIWGASFPPGEVGIATSHGRAIENLLHLLNEHGYLSKVVCIVDGNKDLHGKSRLGFCVLNPEIIKNHPDALIIVNTISLIAIKKELESMKVKNDFLIIPYYYYHGTLDHYYSIKNAFEDICKYEAEIRSLYSSEDDLNKRYLDVICTIRKQNEEDLYTYNDYEGTGENLDYFCDLLLAPSGEVTYIDVGAYDGNSIEPILKFYGKNVKKIIAFEPDNISREKLKMYLQERNIADITQVYSCALGDENKCVKFTNSGLFSIVSEDGENTLVSKIYDELPNVTVIGDAMVKMDIEGSELNALKGMKNFILTHEPYLAICIYHKVHDLYEIASYIKMLNPSYRLYIRGGWHLECWAVPRRHFE